MTPIPTPSLYPACFDCSLKVGRRVTIDEALKRSAPPLATPVLPLNFHTADHMVVILRRPSVRP